MFLARGTEPLREVESVRPGDIARNRVSENRLECATIPMQDPMRRRQLILSRSTRLRRAVRLRVIDTTIKRQAMAGARQHSLSESRSRSQVVFESLSRAE